MLCFIPAKKNKTICAKVFDVFVSSLVGNEHAKNGSDLIRFSI